MIILGEKKKKKKIGKLPEVIFSRWKFIANDEIRDVLGYFGRFILVYSVTYFW